MQASTKPRRRNPYGKIDTLDGALGALILLAIGGMAAAATFTHVHDWTLANSPTGTPDWFGWANATITELLSLGVLFQVRRRKRRGQHVGIYPWFLIVGAAIESMCAQVSVAMRTPVGVFVAVIPALAFLGLTKMVMTTPKRAKHQPQQSPAQPYRAAPVQVAQLTPTLVAPQPVPAAPAPTAVPVAPVVAPVAPVAPVATPVPATVTRAAQAPRKTVTTRVVRAQDGTDRHPLPPYPGRPAMSALTGKPLEQLNTRTKAPTDTAPADAAE